MGSPTGAAGRVPGVPGTAGGAGSEAGLPALGVVVMSPWGWRILAVFAMVAAGLCLTFFLDGKDVFGGLWVFVTLAWGGFGYALWRRHLDWDRNDRERDGRERDDRPPSPARGLLRPGRYVGALSRLGR